MTAPARSRRRLEQRRGRVALWAGAIILGSASAIAFADFAGKLPANTVLGNSTGATADARALALPSCSDSGGNHLNWVSGTGYTCGTSSNVAIPADTAVVYSTGLALAGDATNFKWTAATRQLSIIADVGGGGDLDHRYGLNVIGGDANATGAIQGGMSASTSRFALGTLDTAPTPHTYLKGYTSAYAVEPVALNPAGGQVLTGTYAYDLYTGSFVTKNIVGGSKFVHQLVTQGGGTMGGMYEDGSGNAEYHVCASGAACNSDGTVAAKVRSSGLSYFPQVAVKDTLSCSGTSALNTDSAGQITCGAVGASALVFATGTAVTLTMPAEIYECTGTCTITMPVPAAGYQFCVRNANNVATVITFAAIGSSARYENTARTAYGTAGTGTFVSGGSVLDQVCFVGKDSTHYDVFSYGGSWTAS